jgi:ribosomal protein S18 acetylase RimI-like enzyme
VTAEIEKVGPADRQRAIAVQVTAFVRDPIMRWLYPDAHDYLTHYPAFVAAFGGGAFEHDTAWQAGGFGGVSFWLPPNAEIDGDAIGAVIQETVAPEIREQSFPMLEQMEEHHIREPHWYLPMIGVEPSQQGRGLGSALLAHRLAECDAQGLPAYLESSNPANVPLYERHGFRVVAEIQSGDSPTAWPMLRAPGAR